MSNDKLQEIAKDAIDKGHALGEVLGWNMCVVHIQRHLIAKVNGSENDLLLLNLAEEIGGMVK